MPTKPRRPWHERLALPVSEVGELLTLGKRSMHDLINDWAFGDPAKLPTSGSSIPHKRIPVEAVQAYLKGERQYPPGDPRGQASAAEPQTATA